MQFEVKVSGLKIKIDVHPIQLTSCFLICTKNIILGILECQLIIGIMISH